jgi:uncharacterized membrane protein YdjX (TVP38/TMEM64 family)
MPSKKLPWKAIIGVALLGLFFLVLRQFDLAAKLQTAQAWVADHGAWGPVAFIGIYIVAVVAALPASILTAGAGGIFGWWAGLIYVSVAATMGACLAFLISRYLARNLISRWLGDNPTFRKLDALTAKHGKVIVAVTRLAPIFPFNLQNYGFGLTQVPFRTYAFWSWLCMLPGTALYVVGGDVLTAALKNGRVPWRLVIVLMVMLIGVLLLVARAKRRFEKTSS